MNRRCTFRVCREDPEGSWSYECEVELPEKTTLEELEAHAKTMLRILDEQAASGDPTTDDDAT